MEGVPISDLCENGRSSRPCSTAGRSSFSRTGRRLSNKGDGPPILSYSTFLGGNGNDSNPLWHPQGWQYGIVGSQFDSAYDPPIGLDIFHCPDGCGHIFTAANTTVNVATAREVALVGGALSAPAVVTAATTAYGWGYGAYAASATGVVALGSHADTELAALEDGVSKLSVSPGMYNFLNNMGQW